MHPSSEILSSLFLLSEKTRQHMQRIDTHYFKQAVESAGSGRFGAAVLARPVWRPAVLAQDVLAQDVLAQDVLAQDVLTQIYTDNYTLYTALSVGVYVRTSR